MIAAGVFSKYMLITWSCCKQYTSHGETRQKRSHTTMWWQGHANLDHNARDFQRSEACNSRQAEGCSFGDGGRGKRVGG